MVIFFPNAQALANVRLRCLIRNTKFFSHNTH